MWCKSTASISATPNNANDRYQCAAGISNSNSRRSNICSSNTTTTISHNNTEWTPATTRRMRMMGIRILMA